MDEVDSVLQKTGFMTPPSAPLHLKKGKTNDLPQLSYPFSIRQRAFWQNTLKIDSTVYKVTPVSFNTKHIFGYRQKRCLIVVVSYFISISNFLPNPVSIIFLKVEISKSERSFSIREIYVLEVPLFNAKSCCVNPLFNLASLIN